MAKRKKVDFNLASEVFEDASLTDKTEKEEGKKTLIPLDKLITNPYQPRLQINKKSIEELANSIKKNGLLQAITVVENNNDTFTIVFGHRRVAAYEFLNKEHIEAIVIDKIDEKNLAIVPIIENLQRKDMEPIETALALDKVLKMKVVKTQEELSKSIGVSQGRISKLLTILKLSDNVLEEIRKTKYKDSTVLAALNKVEKSKQIDIFNKIKNFKREDALAFIKNILISKKEEGPKRVVYANNTIKINIKGLSKEKKEELFKYIEKIKKIFNDTSP